MKNLLSSIDDKLMFGINKTTQTFSKVTGATKEDLANLLQSSGWGVYFLGSHLNNDFSGDAYFSSLTFNTIILGSVLLNRLNFSNHLKKEESVLLRNIDSEDYEKNKKALTLSGNFFFYAGLTYSLASQDFLKGIGTSLYGLGYNVMRSEVNKK